MRNSFVITSVLGILLMFVGATTTFIALGQNAEATQEVQEATVLPTATYTLVPQPTAIPAVESMNPANNNPPPVNLVPTAALPTQSPPTLPPTLIPSPTAVTPAILELASPTLADQTEATVATPTTPIVSPSVVPTVTGEILAEAAQLTPGSESQPATPTVLVELNPTVESTEEPTIETQIPQMPTQLVHPMTTIQAEIGKPSGALSDENAAITDLTLTALPTLEQTPVTAIIPTVLMIEETTIPSVMPTADAVTPDPLTGQLTAGAQTMTSEAITLTDLTAEVTEAVESVPAFVLGQINSPIEVSMTLLLPNGETMNQMVDEQGIFSFEVFEPGDYRLEAVAAGYLSREMTFTLAAGESLELPPTIIDSRDPNQDNRIDIDDIVLVAANFDGPALVTEADLNDDDWIDISDLTLVTARFGLAGPLPWGTS